ncbi:MAG TPA: acryloyl-CoA reductase [Desulfobulbus sp.]|nr:acryloyl-CoA reductase [Desulfobulbus sp.]
MKQIKFQALVVSKKEDGGYQRSLQWQTLEDLPDNEVLIKVEYSSLNYKDALSADGNRGVTRRYPHTPGIDAVGRIHSTGVDQFSPGEKVLCMGYDLGMNTAGGFGGYISVPSSWVMALPGPLTSLEAMQIGTAGFTAGQCVHRLLELGVQAPQGPVLVTGATGGVGSIAIRLLAAQGFEVVTVTGKSDQHAFLHDIGASKVIDRQKFLAGAGKLLLRERWAGVVDTVGGDILATAIKGTRYDGVVTSCGNAASGDLPLSVYPFILRGVTLAGIDSARCSMERRMAIWEKLSGPWRLPDLATMCRTVSLQTLDAEIDRMLSGGARGRVVVDMREAV